MSLDNNKYPRNKPFFIQDKKKEGAMLVTVEDKNFNAEQVIVKRCPLFRQAEYVT